MDAPLTEIEAHLGEWLDRVRDGAEVVITDSGLPIAKLLGIPATATIERLATDGMIGQQRPAPRPTAAERLRPSTRKPVSDIISDQRE